MTREATAASGIVVPDWPAPRGIRALVTTRHAAGVSAPPFDHFNLGARCGDAPAAVRANRNELVRRFALPAAPCWLNQVHGRAVARLDAQAAAGWSDESAVAGADAAVTGDAGVVLAVLTADCLPVLLCADDGSEIGIAHAGWRGLCAGVLETAVAALQTPPPRLLAWLGPAAGPGAYEVGDEVREAFVARDARAAAAFVPGRPGHHHCDLYALARQRLADAGVTRQHGGGYCTISDAQHFYSHRRDGRCGRMASLVWRL